MTKPALFLHTSLLMLHLNQPWLFYRHSFTYLEMDNKEQYNVQE